MTNSNSADISVFEGLQANANASMGAGSTSQMSVFNSPQDLKSMDAYLTQIEKLNTEYEKLKQQVRAARVIEKKASEVMTKMDGLTQTVTRLADKVSDDMQKLPDDEKSKVKAELYKLSQRADRVGVGIWY